MRTTELHRPPAFTIDPRDGSLIVGDHRLVAGERREDVERRLAAHVKGERDHGNGYAWLELAGLGFGGHSAWLSLCFFNGRLREAGWHVRLPGAADDWPTTEDIQAEITFVRDILARETGKAVTDDDTVFPWGVLWSGYDPRSGTAANGLRYR